MEQDRLRKASTVATYRSLLRSQILPTFSELPLESITPSMIERWIGAMDRTAATRTKALAMMHGIFQRARKVWGLPSNPVRDVEKPPLRDRFFNVAEQPRKAPLPLRVPANQEQGPRRRRRRSVSWPIGRGTGRPISRASADCVA